MPVQSFGTEPTDDRDRRLSEALDRIMASHLVLTLVGLAEAHGDDRNVSAAFVSLEMTPPEEVLTPLLSLVAGMDDGTAAFILADIEAGVYFVALGAATNMAWNAITPNKS